MGNDRALDDVLRLTNVTRVASGSIHGFRYSVFYRTCVFETLHFPFCLTLALPSLHRWLIGRPDLAIENSIVNAAINVGAVIGSFDPGIRIDRLL